MPTYHDMIMENKMLGREYRRGLIQKRFGPIPEWAQHPLAGQSLAGIEALSLRLLDCASLDELFG